jgi:hypothetical protein
MVTLERCGRSILLHAEQAERLRAAAAARAGVSSKSRDLALVLDWAISQPRRRVVLRRGEASELLRLVEQDATLADLSTVPGLASTHDVPLVDSGASSAADASRSSA